ncbi:MAG: carbamoyltransferase C-terminal domain-containing protein [Myxococcota bacterium]|nr:carbamoyltransferase C-terminal domain-containing protein [Myxococcota bacterium]
MLVLGLADNHDSGAALLEDGRLLAACGQERFDRVKNSGTFPFSAIDAVLNIAERKASEVDRVVVGTAYTPSWLLRRWPSLHHSRKGSENQFDPLLNLYITYQVGLRRLGLQGLEIRACQKVLQGRCLEAGLHNAQLNLMDHHAAHAHAAYRSQQHSECLVLTADAMGDGVTCSTWRGQQGNLDKLWDQSGFAALNTYYSRITQLLGFRPNRHEGKITGLAAMTEPPEDLLAHFREQLHFVGPGFSRTNYLQRQHPEDSFHKQLSTRTREEVASALQANLEEAVTQWVSHWIEKTGIHNIALCGGIFANVKLNQRIAELDNVATLWVYPNMGDGGLAVGAALAASNRPPMPSETMYQGPQYSENEIIRELRIAGLNKTRPDDLALEAATLLEAGKVVGRFAGRMEFGPRALGNRSLLVRPDSPNVNTWLNEQLDRSEFMPFAPVVRQEDAGRFFHGYEKARESARFMTVCFPCTEEFQSLAPGAVHVDGTARPQVLSASDNADYYALLDAFAQRTGLPALINTSFNRHEEPIVCSPHDAISAWKESQLDALILGPFLVLREES